MQVVDGERITMALWFTRDSVHDEDKKLIDQLMNHVMSLLREEKDDDQPPCDTHTTLGAFHHSGCTAPRPSTQVSRTHLQVHASVIMLCYFFLLELLEKLICS